MRRPVTLAALVLTAAVSYGIYEIKYDVVELEQELARLNRNLIAEREAVKVLKAEWSYLNRPERLEKLAERHLELGPAQVRSLASLDEVPLRPKAGGNGGSDAASNVSLPPLPRAKPSRPGGRALLVSGRTAP
jgi:hypothetical protein